jgi:RND family efflux transporter MFP subunit
LSGIFFRKDSGQAGVTGNVAIILVSLVIPVIYVIIALPGCNEKIKPGRTEIERTKVTGITAEIVSPSTVDEYYETAGTVTAGNISLISSRIMGTVKSLNVEEGDHVEKGALLLMLDHRDMTQKVRAADEAYNEALKALEAARANARLARVTYERYKNLYEQKALTGQELDQIETKRNVAELEVERAEAVVKRAQAAKAETEVYLDFARIASPVTGVVTQKNIDAGSMASPGAPLLTIEDTSSYRIDINVDERLAGTVSAGMRADVYLNAVDRQLEGRVEEVVPSVDPMSRTFMVKIKLKGEGLKNGLYARVAIPVGKKEVLLVPGRAVTERGQLTGVYTVDEQSVISYTLIRTGKSFGDKVEVLSGLEPGDAVVVEGVGRAKDGGIAVDLKTVSETAGEDGPGL